MINKSVIGIVELVSVGRRVDVPAKIDTGADNSAIWATNIRVGRDNILRFSLFGEGSPYYNGKIYKRKDYSVSSVKSSNGEVQIRYNTYFRLKLAGRNIKVRFNLSDRSRNEYKILIGRRTINKKFVVDVSKGADRLPEQRDKSLILRDELKDNPHEFHKKYIESQKDRQL